MGPARMPGQHICADCGKVYKYGYGLLDHINKQHRSTPSDKPHPCHYCEKRFWSRSDCLLHTRTHTGVKPFACSECKKKFTSVASRRVHTRQAHGDDRPHACNVQGCEKRFKTRGSLQTHQETHKEPADRTTFPCPRFQCDKSFKSYQGLWWHAKGHGGGRQLKHECSYCGRSFATNTQLQNHVRSHTGEKPYACPKCNKQFSCNAGLRGHVVRTHRTAASVSHVCEMPNCGKMFKTATELKTHLTTHDPGRPIFSCPTCGNDYKTKQGLNLHGKYKHQGVSGGHVCSFCGKTYPASNPLVQHMRRHIGEKVCACGLCGQKFASGGELRSHMAHIHEDGRPFICNHGNEKCGKSFRSGSALRVHVERHKTRDERKMYECGTCGVKLTTNGSLRAHMATQYLEPKAVGYECQLCHKKFAYPGGLKGHIKTHLKEKPYKCLVCGRTFLWRVTWLNHQKTHRSASKVNMNKNFVLRECFVLLQK